MFNNQFVAQVLGVQRNDRTWLFQQYDLTAQAGQQIRLTLGVRNDGVGGRLAMWADNVSIIVCSVAPPPSPTATGSNTPTPIYPTWTPTATPTPLPTLPSGCTSDTIQNGGFESDSAWIFGDSPVRGAFVSTVVHTPLRSVRLGIDPAAGSAGTDRVSYSSIRQPFVISPFASTAQLRWWQFNRTEEAPAPAPPASADRQEVILLQPELKTEVVLSRVRSNETAWTQQLIDLTSYRGQSLVLYFNTYNDGNGLRTWQYLDDVQIDVCFPAVTATPMMPTSTPTVPTLTPTATPTLAPLINIITNVAPLPLAPGSLGAGPVSGEPKVIQMVDTPTPTMGASARGVAASAAAQSTRSPSSARSGSGQVSSLMTWLGVMLGAVAVIGLLVGVALQYTNRSRQP